MMLALGRHLFESTAFALIVGVAVLLCRRRRAASRHTLWLIAVAKFIVPAAVFSFLGSSLHGLFPSTSASLSVPVVLSRWTTLQPAFEPLTSTRGTVFEALIVIWLIGAAVLLLIWLRRISGSLRLSRAAQQLEQPMLSHLRQRLGLRRKVHLQFSDSAAEPVLVGLWQPSIVIPADLREILSPSELESVVLHELVHVKRGDNWTAAVVHVVTCMVWFHPLLWWIEKRLHRERELACDETVVYHGAAPEDYVASILKVCRLSLSPDVAGVSGVSGSNLKSRMEAIMSLSPNALLPRVPRALTGSLIGALTIVPLALGFFISSSTRIAHAQQLLANREEPMSGTVFLFTRHDNAPLRVIEATFGSDDLLLSAKLQNMTQAAITQYRIGWVVVHGNGRMEAFSAGATDVPSGIAPDALEKVPAQGVSSRFVQSDAREIMFFVNDVRFANGQAWSADVNSIEKEAQAENESRRKRERPITCTWASVDYPEGTVIQVGDQSEQMCARVLVPMYGENENSSPIYNAQWIHTSEAIRERGASIVHLQEPPVTVCTPKDPVQKGLCSCEDGGFHSPGATVNSAKGSSQLRCGKDGNWIQATTPNVTPK